MRERLVGHVLADRPPAGSRALRACSPATFLVPAGDPAEPFDYLYKVRLNGTWNENYGDATFGLPDGNIPLAIDQDTELRFTYDHATHKVTVGPAQPAGGLTDADRALAGDSLREDLTRENFYFVMADRFENGDPENDTGFIEGTRSDHGYDPTDQAFYHGGDLQGLIEQPGLHRGPRHDGDLDDTVVQEQARAGRARDRVRRLPRLLDHRLHADRPPPGHQRGAQDPHRPRPRPRHEGLLRHHHQPHRRRPRLPGQRLRRRRGRCRT